MFIYSQCFWLNYGGLWNPYLFSDLWGMTTKHSSPYNPCLASAGLPYEDIEAAIEILKKICLMSFVDTSSIMDKEEKVSEETMKAAQFITFFLY